MILSFDQSFFLVLILVSHITASLFLAKPRFGKVATATIWMIYTILFLLMPPDNPPVSFFLSLVLHSILFFLTTKGQWQARGFLFFSYASIFTCFCTTYNFLMFFVPSIAWKVVWGIGTMLLMQALQLWAGLQPLGLPRARRAVNALLLLIAALIVPMLLFYLIGTLQALGQSSVSLNFPSIPLYTPAAVAAFAAAFHMPYIGGLLAIARWLTGGRDDGDVAKTA